MTITEFDIIQRYFTSAAPGRGDVVLGIGDDAALLSMSPTTTLVETTASSGFDEHTPPGQLAHALLSACLEQLAQHQVEPAWLTLSLTLAQPDPAWLQEFSDALLDQAHAHNIALIGGDTTRGEPRITLLLIGHTHPQAHAHGN
jgi:thiamine-monophosphate kinase